MPQRSGGEMAKNQPVINSSFASALRRGKSREWPGDLQSYLQRLKGKKLVFHKMLQAAGLLARMQRRGPKPGLVAGFDVVWVEMNSNDGSLNCFVQAVDKRGETVSDHRSLILLHVTQHAVESMFQRLRTTDRNAVLAELKPVACWLAENRHTVAMEEAGLVLTEHGVFPVVRAPAVFDDEVDGRYCWDAPTWIADAGLDDHTPQKRRIAEAVKRARQRGEMFIKP
jgi:hypothetical protein